MKPNIEDTPAGMQHRFGLGQSPVKRPPLEQTPPEQMSTHAPPVDVHISTDKINIISVLADSLLFGMYIKHTHSAIT